MSGLGKTKDDFTCPICMYIMIHPVTMPCKHSLCMMCYKQCVEKASLSCPICRLRISVWARRNAKANTLIDRVMWETIQRRFPVEVRNHIEGKDDSTDDNWDSPSAIEEKLRRFKELSEPGEIRQEYEAALEKLERQREEEAKKEEEASAALIRVLQEEEEEELTKLVKQKEEHERLGFQAAEQLFQESNANHPERRLREWARSSKESKKRCESASMKLESFYNSYRKSSNSAPPYSELATTISNSRANKNGRGSKSDYSPYPYSCISPSEKQKVTPSLPSEVTVSEMDELLPCLKEHSYTTASAERIDLTLQDENIEWASILREDVQQYIKVEPQDLDEDPLSRMNDSNDADQTFKPICSSLKTPPKKLPSGELVDPILIRSIPRSLTFCCGGKNQAVSPSISSCSSEICPDQSFEFRDMGREFQVDLKNQNEDESTFTSFGRFTGEKGEDEFVDKMKLTRKIVYGTSKHKKQCPIFSVSSSTSISRFNEHSSSFSSASLPSSTKSNVLVNNSSLGSSLKAAAATSSSLRDVDQNMNKSDKNSVSDVRDQDDFPNYFTSGDAQLIIPLESEVEVTFSDKSNRLKNTDSSVAIKPPQKITVRKKVSKSKSTDHPSCSSIRDWCLKNKRKAGSDSSCGSQDVEKKSDENLTSEESDHQLALELQRLYARQDKLCISVDRFQGSSNEYSFRKKRRLC